MPGKKGVKFRTVHKFGKKRKRKAKLNARKDSNIAMPSSSTSSSAPMVVSSASDHLPIPAAEKLKLFAATTTSAGPANKKQKLNNHNVNQPLDDVNFIVNLQSLNDILAPVKCEDCENSVSRPIIVVFRNSLK